MGLYRIYWEKIQLLCQSAKGAGSRGRDARWRMPSWQLSAAHPLCCGTAWDGNFPNRQVADHSGSHSQTSCSWARKQCSKLSNNQYCDPSPMNCSTGCTGALSPARAAKLLVQHEQPDGINMVLALGNTAGFCAMPAFQRDSHPDINLNSPREHVTQQSEGEVWSAVISKIT
ncbi:uncharacterized protein FN964_013513 isoform 1-T1 [Alca torda]